MKTGGTTSAARRFLIASLAVPALAAIVVTELWLPEDFDVPIVLGAVAMGGVVFAVVLRRALQQARLLRIAEARDRALIDAVPDMMFRAKDDGSILDFKAASGPDPEVRADQFLDREPGEVALAAGARGAVPHVENVLNQRHSDVIEYELSGPDGEQRSYEARTVPITDEGQVVSVVRDITEPRQAEEAVREAERLYRDLFDGSPIAMWHVETSAIEAWLDDLRRAGIEDLPRHLAAHADEAAAVLQSTPWLALNPAARELFGLDDSEDVPPGLLARVMDASSFAETSESIFDFIRKKQDYLETDVQITTLRGDRKQLVMRMVTAAGVGYIIAAIDVTELKESKDELARSAAVLRSQVAELDRINAVLTEFASAASHDLAEPLRMVSSYVQLLARRYEGRLGEDADEFIGYALDGVDRMRRLLDDLVMMSQIVKSDRPFGPCDTQALVHDILDTLKEEIVEAAAAVTTGPLPTVEGDPTELGEVFSNLISNALRFTEAGRTPEIHISAARDEGAWLFSVADKGIGIEPAHQERIFGMFKRLHGRHEFPGTGVGLALSRKIIERHGGRIWVESTPGEGSTFFFTIPDSGGNNRHTEAAAS